MLNLNNLLFQIFSGRVHSYGRQVDNSSIYLEKNYKFLDVPINEERFELPVFLSNWLFSQYKLPLEQRSDAFSVRLFNQCGSGYSSVDCQIRYGLEGRARGCCKVISKTDGSVYHVTLGSVFDKDFNPVMVTTWDLKKLSDLQVVDDSTNVSRFKILKNIIHIDPEVFYRQSNDVERYVCKKLVNHSLNVFTPTTTYPLSWRQGYFYDVTDVVGTKGTPRIVIDDIPFEVKTAKTPDINTSTADLLNVAKENIDEIVKWIP